MYKSYQRDLFIPLLWFPFDFLIVFQIYQDFQLWYTNCIQVRRVILDSYFINLIPTTISITDLLYDRILFVLMEDVSSYRSYNEIITGLSLYFL